MRITVRTYADLAKWLTLYTSGKSHLMFLVGTAGIGKSRHLKALAEKTARWCEGAVSAYGLYKDLYENIDVPYVLDDVDGLYKDKACVALLKQLCNTEKTKTMCWLKKSDLPKQFQTSSRVMIIANEWNNLNKNIGAVEDRGTSIIFDPPAEEVHAEILRAGWFKNKPILQFMEDHLHLIRTPSFRQYVTAEQTHGLGLDWKSALLETWDLTTEETAFLNILREPYPSEEIRMSKWCESTGMSRATFFNYKRKFKKA